MATTSIQTKCFLVEKKDESVSRTLETSSLDRWPEGDVVVRVSYSSLNFKDALAASGNPGVARSLPIVPGIDAVGIVESCETSDYKTGDAVYIAHPEFGTSTWGGWSERVRVPASWVYRLPDNLDERSFMIYGTAGFTAAQCVASLQHHHVVPENGPVVVTGATGGVGIFAVKLLSQLGYEVVASTGKQEKKQWLLDNGASKVVGRDDVNDTSKRPLLSGHWAGAVDTVGGNTLATIIRGSKVGACVTACGVVGGADLTLTVYPFILRGVTLSGIDSANVTDETRKGIWDKLGNEWSLQELDSLTTEVALDQLNDQVETILDGKVAGRVIINMKASD